VHFPSGKEELEGAVDVVAPFPVLGFTNGSSSRDITRGLPQAWEASSERLLPGTLSLGCFRASSVRKAVVSLYVGSGLDGTCDPVLKPLSNVEMEERFWKSKKGEKKGQRGRIRRAFIYSISISISIHARQGADEDDPKMCQVVCASLGAWWKVGSVAGLSAEPQNSNLAVGFHAGLPIYSAISGTEQAFSWPFSILVGSWVLICPSWPLGTLYPSVQEEQGCNVVRISAWVRFLCEARLAKCFLGIKAQLPSQVRSSAAGNVISDSSYRRGLGKRRWAGVTSLRAIPYSRTDIINDRDE
jgi:hypothetical protein